MKDEKKVERVKRTLVREGSILDIYDDEMRLPDGSTEHWDFVSHRKGAACTVAVLDDKKILLSCTLTYNIYEDL